MTDTSRPTLYRSYMIEMEETPAVRGLADGRIPVALSSEMQVERLDWRTGERYLEELDHGPGGVDLSHARAGGLPFLLDHKLDVQVGRIEDLQVGADRKIRGFIRMGNHPDAAWVEKDIRGGVRPSVSVGYDPGEQYTKAKSQDGKVVRTYRGWKPVEGSSVAVPADVNVGIGRAATGRADYTERPDAKGRILMTDSNTTDRQRLAEIARDFASDGSMDLYPSWIERGLTPDQAFAELRQRITAQLRPAPVPPGEAVRDLTNGEKRRRWSWADTVRAQIPDFKGDPGFGREISQEIARRTGQQPRGMFVPMTSDPDGWLTRTVLTTGGSGTGSEFVPTMLGEPIDILRAKTTVLRLGARMIPVAGGKLAYPRKLTGSVAHWMAENPGSAVTASNPTWEQVTLAGKTLLAQVPYTRQLLLQSTPAIDAVITDDLVTGFAVELDRAALNGAGTDEPVGVVGTSGVPVVLAGTNGATVSFAKIAEMASTLDGNNALTDQAAFITTPGCRWRMAQIDRFTSAGLPLWDDGGKVLGFAAESTNNMPSNLTKGTSTTICSAAIFGAWNELLVGTWSGVDLVVDPYTDAGKAIVHVTAFTLADVAVRQPKAFAICKDFLTT